MPVNPALPDACLPQAHRSVRAVLSAALDAIGVESATGGFTSAADRAALGLPRAQRTVVVLVDGLGARQLQRRSGHAPTLARLARERDPITTVAPSTTAAAISALTTGQMPSRTAMMGYSLRDGAGQKFSLIAWRDTEENPDRWQAQPTLFQASAQAGVPVASVAPHKFIGSGLTLAAMTGAVHISAESLSERVDATLAALRSGQRAVYLYWGEVDAAGHKYGVSSPEWTSALEETEAELSRLLRQVPPDTLTVVTADHGMVDPITAQRIDITDDAALMADVALTAGEERALHVYLDPGANADTVADRWRTRLAELTRATSATCPDSGAGLDCLGWVLTKDQLIVSELLGPNPMVRPEACGDLLVFARGRAGFHNSDLDSPAAMAMPGVHGSLTEEEMLIPLIAEVR